MRMRSLIFAALLLVLPSAANAEWHEASSPHFVIYADDNPVNIQRFSQELERYHSALEYLTERAQPAPSPSNRVTIYVVRNDAEVRRLAGDGSRYLQGFCRARAGGSAAFIPKVEGGSRELDGSKLVLLHEYAHHFMLSGNPFGLPNWLSEGGAEFFASASFKPDGGMLVGRPANHRAMELLFAKDVSVRNLLDPDSYTPPVGRSYDAFYGKAWALFHYLTFEPVRGGQLDRYQILMRQGKSSREAGETAFGDFKVLEGELEKYLKRSTLKTFVVAPEHLSPGATLMRKLSAGEAAMMPVIMQSKRGVDEAQAAKVVVEARAVAARFPSDGRVLAALAEAEFDSGHDAEAVSAADKALAIDPTLVNAWLQKGYALFRTAETSGDQSAFRRARTVFAGLNRLENDHPLPLVYYYRSFVHGGQTVPQIAKQGLERASELAPFDLSLRYSVAQMQLADGRKIPARANLKAVAANPHGGALSEQAQADLAELGPEVAPVVASPAK